jgi:hypothetical protein
VPRSLSGADLDVCPPCSVSVASGGLVPCSGISTRFHRFTGPDCPDRYRHHCMEDLSRCGVTPDLYAKRPTDMFCISFHVHQHCIYPRHILFLVRHITSEPREASPVSPRLILLFFTAPKPTNIRSKNSTTSSDLPTIKSVIPSGSRKSGK